MALIIVIAKTWTSVLSSIKHIESDLLSEIWDRTANDGEGEHLSVFPLAVCEPFSLDNKQSGESPLMYYASEKQM